MMIILTAQVNEPSEYEPLKFDYSLSPVCILQPSCDYFCNTDIVQQFSNSSSIQLLTACCLMKWVFYV